MTLGSELAGNLAVDAYERAAKVTNLAAIICETAGTPLNEIQTNAIAHAILQAFDGLQAEFEAHMDIDAELRTARWLIGPSP